MKHRALLHTLTAALALAGAAGNRPAQANPWNGSTSDWANGQAVSVQLQVDGRTTPLYLSSRDDARRYFEAFAGRNYSVVLRNNTGQRLGVLVAVDGLNVVSGLRSHLAPDENMYVLDPWQTTTIRGWRTSLDDIQRFVFVDEQRSYAARTGQANGDMGWVRVLAYREQRPWWTPRPRYVGEDRSRSELQGGNAEPNRDAQPPAAAPAMPAPTEARSQAEVPQGEMKAQRRMAADGLARSDEGGSYPGTGWGEHRSDPVQRVEFTAERHATDTLVFRYEYTSGLRALGILPDRDRLRDRDNGELGFAKPPRW